jgi:hypothetical protein
VESSAKIGNWNDVDKIQVTVLKLTETAKVFYSSNLELRAKEITWENFKANFLHRFRDIRTDQYHFMQLQTARQKRDETPQEFLDRCLSLAMRTVPKLEDPMLEKFHYDQAQCLFLSSFIAGLDGHAGQQYRFQMPSTVDQALGIAVTVYEAERQQKRNLAFFSNARTYRRGSGNFGQPWKTFGRPECRQDVRRGRNGPHAAVRQRQQNARPTSANREGIEGKVFCFKCGKSGHFFRDCFSNHAFTRKSEGKNQFPQTQATGRPSKTYAEVTRRNTHCQENS